jgi:hypothetical protein
MKKQRKPGDFKKRLDDHLNFMKASMIAYDDGFEEEALRLSNSLRIILHDTSTSTSILKHLGIKNSFFFISTSECYVPCNVMPYMGLIGMSVKSNSENGTSGAYIPSCNLGSEIPNKWLSFNDWWNEIVIDDKQNIFTRKDIVINVCNTDGGAHVDSKLNEEYSKLIEDNSLGWEIGDENIRKPLDKNPAFASIRQIAEEFIKSVSFRDDIRKYTDRKLIKELHVNYIRNVIYIYEIRDPVYSSKIFKDARITKTETRKYYRQNVILSNDTKDFINIIT